MNRVLKHHLFTRMDDAQNDLVYAEQVKEEPEVLTRMAEIVSLYRGILNPITPTANDETAFIASESPPSP
jgi:hypothetical protein